MSREPEEQPYGLPTATRGPTAGTPVAAREHLPADYPAFFEALKARIQRARLTAAVAVNRELIATYWDLGREIIERQEQEGWGASVIARLSADLRAAFPGVKGFTERNIAYARAFYLAYTRDVREHAAILQQPVAELDPDLDGVSLPEPVARIPWGHNVRLLDKVADPVLRLWYARQSTAQGWSRKVLWHQIDTRLHERLGRADQATNFARTLPAPQSDLARELVKDPYSFEFLAIAEDAHERHLEQGLLAHLREFLLELGVGFAFVGSQHRLVVGGEEFFIDLLFYHLKLRCFVVIDLKMEAFKPEFAGKMGFYLTTVDEQLRHAGDQPSIGLILCKEKNAVVVEYTLRDVAKPIGVSEYRVSTALPAPLRDSLPTTGVLEAELRSATAQVSGGENAVPDAADADVNTDVNAEMRSANGEHGTSSKRSGR